MSIHLHYVVVVVHSLNCVWLCDPIDASLSFTISWNLSRFISMESVWLSNHVILCSPFLLLQSLPASGSFPMSQLFALGGQGIGASASISVLPKNIQGWFPLRLTGLISLQSKGLLIKSLLQHHNSTASSSALSFVYSPTLTSIHDYWKNHSFDYVDLYRKSDVSAF